jgi:hypothetical protein
MTRVNLALVEYEMRILAEERVQSIAGDAPTLTRTQTAKVWGKSPPWVKAMQVSGRVPTVPFGKRDHVVRAVAIIGLIKGV